MDVCRILELLRELFRFTAVGMQNIMEPQNKEVVEYCLKLVGAKFVGETSNKVDSSTDEAQEGQSVNLGSVLQSMHYEMQNSKDNFTGEEERFMELFEMAIKVRRPNDVDPEQHREKMLKDKEKFVQLYKQKTEPTDSLKEKHHCYWGTRQQLRFGKVVADWIDKDYGPLDPIFGILLSPTGGRTGPGDNAIIHWLFFDDNGKFAYHSAVHDAFGYLLTSHKTGPGYKYLDAASMFERSNPLSEQASGVRFWRTVLCEHKDNGIGTHTC